MKKTLRDTREIFKNYFNKNSHQIVSSSPLIPQNDPTLMFTNSGMVQFKNVFTGVEKRDYLRATTSQKCVRAGGKHNDLENVGYTPRHHTFFEMLGNFSFGDYFKEQAIFYAWELITKEFGLPKEKLCVTVYSEDQEAFNIWKKITNFSDEKIIKIPTTDNFWSMGDTGPCGPCSEIFYDHGDHLFGGPPGSKDQDGDRFIEIWNLVFMQFEQIDKNKRINLPKPSVDTGMGLERMAAVLQETHDNYEIDLFKNLINLSSEITKTKVTKETIPSHRVIADHLRASCFLIADGLMPSNEGRGYVLRRIMRRAMRHINTLGSKENVLSKMITHLIKEMSSEYSELERAKDLIRETIVNEEEKFSTMLNNGMKIINEEIKNIKNNTLSGEVAFKLYDTYGFPLDLTQDYFKPKNIRVDTDQFEQLMNQRKEEARKSWKGSGSSAIKNIWYDLKDKFGATEFVGYNTDKTEAKVLSILSDDKETESLKKSSKGILILNQTCFYAEAGGQIGDSGIIKSANGIFKVDDTQKFFGNFFVHIGEAIEGELKNGDDVSLEIDEVRKKDIKANHSATHLLHAALRENLGNHVAQKGSYVGSDRLRFDFSHSKQISKSEIDKINAKVNEVIKQNDTVMTKLMSPEKAIKEGAMALFGEKYGDEVRVVSMGKNNGKIYSIELCGGTHVEKTGDIGVFSIISEGSISSGIRRIEALRGEALKIYEKEEDSRRSDKLKLQQDKLKEISQKIKELGGDNSSFAKYESDKQIIDAQNILNNLVIKSVLLNKEKNIINNIKQKNINFYIQKIYDLPSKEIRPLVDGHNNNKSKSIAFIFSIQGIDKLSIGVGVTEDLTKDFNASDFAKKLSLSLNGKGGGGRKDFAQSGGSNTSLDDIDKAVDEIISKI